MTDEKLAMDVGAETGRVGSDPLVDRFDLIFLLRRYWKVLLVGPLVCGLASLVLVSLKPDVFESSTLIYIDPKFDQIIRFEKFEGSSGSDLDALSSLQIMIVADTMVLRVVDRLHLREEKGFLPEGMAGERELSEQRLVRYLQQERFSAALVEGTRLLKITVKDPDPERAQRIAGAFADEFDEFLIAHRQDEAKRARVSLGAQVGEARRQALEDEQKLRELRESHPQFPVEQDHDMFAARLTQFSSDLNTVESQRMELEAQVAYLAKIDPATSPMVIFKVAGYESDQHVADLMGLRAASAARLAAADGIMLSSERAYVALAGEFRRNDEMLRETAAQVKLAVGSKYEATKAREEALRSQLEEVKAQLVEVKSLSTEFRALQQQAERSWSVVENLQAQLSESLIAMETQRTIATEVSQPLKPYKKAGSGGLLLLVVGGCLGVLFSLTWLGARLLIGLPYTHRDQLERRFGLPVLADWTPAAGGEKAGVDAMLLHSLAAGGAQVIHFVAAGPAGLAGRVVRRVADMSARAGSKTLLVMLSPKPWVEGAEHRPKPVGNGDLVRLDAPVEAALRGDALGIYLQQHGSDFRQIFVACEGAVDPIVVDWLSGLSDRNVIIVPAGSATKRVVDRPIEMLVGPGLPPAGILFVSGIEEKAAAASGRVPAAEPRIKWRREQVHAG